MIRIDSLTHRYPRQKAPALDRVDLDIAEGSITGVIGPNGSGKTTLFTALSGRLAPTSGRILFSGAEIDREERAARSICVGIDRDFSSARAASVLRAARLRPTWDESIFTRLAERFSLAARGGLGRRSQGQRSLFITSIALASGAPLTLLDEPTGSLDVPTRMALAEEIIRVNAEADGARTVVIASHLVSELESLIEHVVILSAGRVVSTLNAGDLVSRVIALIGDPATIRRLVDADPHARILSERPLGRLAEIRIADASPRTLDAAVSAGVESAPLSFQDAFVSLIGKEN
ncbi:ABC transporter ATP-binding protein [Actinomyces sp. B33]|uniref:ATP-binding cassette domain-containing protein n=1 Tax=Actinomyces sp. B33 TaxID=2942131 RepID=UPI0023422B9D|nr:ABC transporter ATP-binding protein [Actinomyces sp. B33]MDC4233508.1 ABC transporter ATP-binding protein [Actinomyces sp. B33]